jgi:Fe-S oxidoreductase
LYDFGMLGAAKRLLRQILDTLRAEIEAGVPIIGLEPSCIAVFRDEMTNLFPDDEDAKRLRDRSFLISEFFETMLDGYQPPQLKHKAIIHGHCHQKAIVGMAHEKSIFSKLGLDYEILDSGCCGMAGSFGFEAGHYEVSMNVGELVLLPAVRRASKQTLIIADGFSCREQIRQGTDREALHTAQVLQLALEQSGVAQTRTNSRNYSPDGSPYPEKTFSQEREHERLRAQRQAAFKFGAAAALGVLLWASKRKRVAL